MHSIEVDEGLNPHILCLVDLLTGCSCIWTVSQKQLHFHKLLISVYLILNFKVKVKFCDFMFGLWLVYSSVFFAQLWSNNALPFSDGATNFVGRFCPQVSPCVEKITSTNKKNF